MSRKWNHEFIDMPIGEESEQNALRKKWAGECGVGFELPASIVPNVPKTRAKSKRAKAA